MASARRELLLRVHSFRLRREDLEDAYSQATLELIAHVRRGGSYASRLHLANTLEQRFLSRVHDRRRALCGRSAMHAAIEQALPLDGAPDSTVDIHDVRAELDQLVILREELERVRALAAALSYDQRLLIACQVGLQMGCADFCRIFGWTPEKYRKVGQRARKRLRDLIAADNAVPSGGAASEQKPGTSL